MNQQSISASRHGAIAGRSLRVFVLLAALLLVTLAHAQEAGKPEPTHKNISYGPYERNVLDFWKANSTKPAPLVIYIHGGGFAMGSKDDLRGTTVREFLDAGISVAAVNYRYYQQAGLPAALRDCRRALQFVRSKSAEWNLDKSRAGAFGGSAGAITSMYLAFHDDMANPQSDDPIERESTRLMCVATTAGQTTLDTDWWAKNVPGWSKTEGVKDDIHAHRRWGCSEADFPALIADGSALHLISRDDPPIWMSYGMRPEGAIPAEPRAALNWKIHHVAFGVALKKKRDALGMESHLNYPGSKESQYAGLTKFLIAKLQPAVKSAEARTQSNTPPYPPSPVIKEIVWASTNNIIRQARDGDNWPVTWASDDAIYTTWGDGTGFLPKVEKKLSCGFARVTGSPPDFIGENIRSSAEQLGQGRSGLKGWGIFALGDVLYLWFGHANKNGGEARLAWSQDRARTWTFADWKFSEFGLMGFVNFGRGYEGARDNFVYAYSHDGLRADTPADRFILMRAPKDQLTQRAAWEFFVGINGDKQPLWTNNIAGRGAVFRHHGACQRSAMTYDAALRRYLWWQHIPQPPGHPDGGDTRFEGGFAIYDAPEPWGPWTTAFFTTKWDVGPGEHGDFPAKWMKPDGRTAWLVFSGDDCFSVREATFVLVRP